MKSPKIGIVIVNLNRKNDTLRCIASVLTSDYDNYEVLIIDNNSSDGSVETIQEIYPEVRIIRNPKNLGFTGGNNIGIQYFLNQGVNYVFLLNNDATIEPKALSSLAGAASSHPQAGFLGAKICALEDPNIILHAGGFFSDKWETIHRGLGEIDTGQFNSIDEVDYLLGCAMLVKCKIIKAIGLLDETFFAYHEEIDWCYRGKQAGYKVLFVPAAKVLHPDFRTRDANSAMVTYYISRNTLQFAKKHRLGNLIILRIFISYGRTLLSWSIRPRWRHKNLQRNALMHALFDFVRGKLGPYSA